MFHVELKKSRILKKGKRISFFLFLFFVSCGISRQKTEIPDYLILEHGKSNSDKIQLNAFVFENFQRKISFPEYISMKYKTQSIFERQIWVKIEDSRYLLNFYDNDEFDKYFGLSNFTLIHQETEANTILNASKYIAISVVDENNQDALADQYLAKNIVMTYLQNLKEDYLKTNGLF